jgi:hypothetical protein
LENINALKQMRELRFAPFVRLEVDCEMPQDVIQRLSNELGLSNKDDVYTVCGQMALGDLDSLPVKLGVDSPLIFTPWSPKTHPRLQGSVSTQHLKKKSCVHSLGLNLSVLTHIRFKCDDASCKQAPFPFQQLVAKKESDLVFWSFCFTASSKLWLTINVWYYGVHPQGGSFQSHKNLIVAW